MMRQYRLIAVFFFLSFFPPFLALPSERQLFRYDWESEQLSEWSPLEGDFRIIDYPASSSYPGPAEGKNYLFGGRAPRSIIERMLPLPEKRAGFNATLEVSLYGGTGGDSIEARLEALDFNGEPLQEVTTGPIHYDRWVPYSLPLRLSEEMASLRVRLIARRQSGEDNDGFVDALTLSISEITPPAKLEILAGPVLTIPEPESIYLWWHLNGESDNHVIEYGESLAMEEKVSFSERSSYPYWHLKSLKPATAYYYRVRSEEAISPIYRFKTPNVAASFRMGIWGDNQHGFWIFGSKTVPMLLRNEPDLVMGVGDLVDNGARYKDWLTQFYTPARKLLATVPMLPVRGNHDGESTLAYQICRLPGNGSWYATTYGSVRFVVLDTNLDYRKGTEQFLWFLGETNSPEWKRATYRIVAFHHPPFSNVWDSPNYDGETLVRDFLVPIFEMAGANLVLSGHSHSYQHGFRQTPISGATHYFVIGGGGGTLDTMIVNHWPFITAIHSRYHVAIADVSPLEIRLRAIDTQKDELFDEVVITGGPLTGYR